MKSSILIVDDQPDMATMIADGLIARGFETIVPATPSAAVSAIERGDYDALVTDIRMPEHDGFDLLERSLRAAPDAPVIMMTAFSGIESAIESIRRGAHHYRTKPFRVDELELFLRRALEERAARREAQTIKRALRSSFAAGNLVGETAAMRELSDVVRRIAPTNASVLVLGETGVGKGVVARAIHAESLRAERAFVSVNCASLPENLLESELFGHAKGAFTGAVTAHAGIFAEADGGTLFLDEIAEMKPALQAKLLHVLETGTVRPLGTARERAVDVRIVAATHRDLRARVASGEFREDLLYRLDVVSLEVPPLRFRKDDIPRLAERFLDAARRTYPNAIATRFGTDAMRALVAHPWPGNVRELKHAVDRAVLLGTTPEIGASDLGKLAVVTSAMEFGDAVLPLREIQRRYVQWALAKNGGHKRQTCEALGIDHKTLNRWLDGG
ncbi:sigma-54 dependent transcriptional regulator [soil metagenome]